MSLPSGISQLLRQRGHKIVSEGSDDDIFLPATEDGEILDAFKVLLYRLMRNDEVRKVLRDWAYGKTADEVPDVAIIESYMTLCSRFGARPTSEEAIRARYARTFEWYVSQLFIRELGARGSGFNIRLADANPDDEFDCIAVIDDGVVFVECKTGRGAIFREIAKFVRRDIELDADYSLFIFDRDYTFQREGEDTPRLSAEQARELGIESVNRVQASNQTCFRIDAVQTTYPVRPFLFACGAFGGLEDRIRYIIRYTRELQRRRRVVSPLFTVEWVQFISDDESPEAERPGSEETPSA